MSYIYDKLKEALGGSKLTESKNTIINDWSPNSIRVIIISRNQIITVNHLGVFGGCTKKVDLDVNLVARDLDEISRTNYGKPKLNTLLNKRSFSCLEEIYVDAMFMNYPRVLDIVGYAQELLSTKNSRLRHFGYGDLMDECLRDYLNSAFKEAYTKKNYAYSFAEDRNRPAKIEYKDTLNSEWYRKYYLRPQYYKKDRQGGDLEIHFKKVEDGCQELLRGVMDEEKSGDYISKLLNILERDENNKIYLKKIDKLLAHITSNRGDVVLRKLLPCFKKVLTEERYVVGLHDCLVNVGFSDKEMSWYYEKYKVLNKDSKGALDIERYGKGTDGFIPLGKILDDICLSITDRLMKEGYKDLVGMALVYNLNIPEGDFSKKYLNRMEVGKDSANYQGYIDYIEDIVGVEV